MEITLEQVERLREKSGVSYAQSKAALEHTQGDLLEALIWLEQQGQAQPPRGGSYSTPTQTENREVLHEVMQASRQEQERSSLLDRVMEALTDLLRRGMANELTVSRQGQVITSVPVLIALALLVVAFWVAIPLLIAGFVFGCRYSFTGPDLDREQVRKVMDTVNDGADGVRRQVITELHKQREKHAQRSHKGK